MEDRHYEIGERVTIPAGTTGRTNETGSVEWVRSEETQGWVASDWGDVGVNINVGVGVPSVVFPKVKGATSEG